MLGARPPRRRTNASPARAACSAEAKPRPLRLTALENWSAAERLRREFEAVGFFLSGHPLDAYQKALERLRVDALGDFRPRACAAARRRRGSRATVLDRAERRTKIRQQARHRPALRPQSGQYEAILFQEGLNQYRDLLEKGADVLVTLQANVEGEDVRARIIQVERLDEAARQVQKGLRVFVRDEAPLPCRAQAEGRAEGEVSLVVMLGPKEGEVEIKLPGRYPINPQASSAIKAIPGVAEVELV